MKDKKRVTSSEKHPDMVWRWMTGTAAVTLQSLHNQEWDPAIKSEFGDIGPMSHDGLGNDGMHL